MAWRPGQQPNRELETPYEDLPEHLEDHVHGWMRQEFLNSSELTRSIALRARIAVPSGSHSTAIGTVMNVAYQSAEDTLNLVEQMLANAHLRDSAVSRLAAILEEGHSAYRVRDDGMGLEMRVLPEIKAQIQAVVDAADEAPGEHLAAAYNAVYGQRIPDTERAYDRAIKAVEAAMRPVVSPRDNSATLTKMILALRDAPQKWQFAVVDERDTVPTNAPAADGVQVVLDMMRLLAYGQRQRHGENGPVVLNTAEQAQAAVMIAVTLVQFVNDGVFSTR